MLKRAAAWSIKAALLALLIDGIFGLFAVLSIHRGNPYRIYYPSRLAAEVEASLQDEADAPATGWPKKGVKLTRDHPPLARECGSAWGGSFTFSPDVPDDSTWPYLGSRELGCDIANYGVPAFGLDQTYLLYQQYSTPKSVIVLGMSLVMITTMAISSWTFFDLNDGLPRARVTKPFFTLDNAQLVLHRRPAPSTKAILDFYREDGYGDNWTPLSFPFSRSVIRAFQMKLHAPDLPHQIALSQGNARYRAVASAVIRAMATDAIAKGDQFVLLLLPTPVYQNELFAELLRASIDQVPSVCFIDPTDEINKTKAGLSNPADIGTESNHFSAIGNAAIARALVKGMADCGIHP
jgi:hypothetical protein